MTITLPAEEDCILSRRVALGRFATPEEAIVEAVRRLESDEVRDFLNPQALTPDEAAQVYAADGEWERVEHAVAGRAKPEA